MNWKIAVAAAFGILLLLGVGAMLAGYFPGSGGQASSREAAYSGIGVNAPSAPGVANMQPVASDTGNPSPSPQKLIKTASASIEVPAGTIEDRLAKLKGIVASKGGQVLSADYSETETEKTYYITLKIMPSEFEDLAQTLKQVGSVKSMSSNIQDVTNDYVDVEIRISNLEKQRASIVALLNSSNGNSTLSDILAVETELNRIQTQIEMYQTEKLNMDRQSDLSTVSVSLYESAPLIDKTVLQPLSQVGNVFLGALGFAIIAVFGLLGFAIPVLICGGILYLAYRKIAPRFFGTGQAGAEKGKRPRRK